MNDQELIEKAEELNEHALICIGELRALFNLEDK